jgi:hypothetical protein
MNIGNEISNKQGEEEKSKNFKALEIYLKVGGLAGILFGLIHLWSITSQGFTPLRLGDAVINATIGTLFLVSAWTLSNRKLMTMWVFGSTILLSLIYGFAVGRGLNYIYIIFGAVLLMLFFSLKKNKEIL